MYAVVGLAVFVPAMLVYQRCSGAQTGADQHDAPLTFKGNAVFNAAKVWPVNLNSGDMDRRCATAIWKADEPLNLASYLSSGAEGEPVNWEADGVPVGKGLLALGREPKENQVRVFKIVARSTGRADAGFILVVIPRKTALEFDRWLAAEKASMAWIGRLPLVYARLGPNYSNPEPAGCNPKAWAVLRKLDSNYHPGAAYEMRSVPDQEGSGHQATYDASGNLLRIGAAAGSADRGSPTYNPVTLIRHAKMDVIPYVWAAQLDGNPVNPKWLYADFDRPLIRSGEHIQAYLDVRPIYGPSRQELPPGVCADGKPAAK